MNTPLSCRPSRRPRFSTSGPIRFIIRTIRLHQSRPDAHGDHDVAGSTTSSFEQCVADHPCPAHAIGVTDGYGAAVDVVALRVDAESIAAVHGLRREGLVELPQVDVVDPQIMPT